MPGNINNQLHHIFTHLVILKVTQFSIDLKPDKT